MKTAIIFATTHGTTKKVAQMIAVKLGSDSCTLINIKETPKIDLSNYNQLVIGASIHAGNIQSSMREFIKQNTVSILEKRVGLFLCYMNEPELGNQIERAFPEVIRKQALSVQGVGGEFLFEKMNFFQRFIVHKISGIKETTSNIKEKTVDQLVKEISI
ncbi:MAG: flavodoxin domain-containing protein [Bacteroidota bacterium]